MNRNNFSNFPFFHVLYFLGWDRKWFRKKFYKIDFKFPAIEDELLIQST